MRVLNKVLKLPFSYLRRQGLSSVEYVDDTLLESDTFLECKHNLITTFTCLEALGFLCTQISLFFTPNQDIEFLGFHINTLRAAIALTFSLFLAACARKPKVPGLSWAATYLQR